MLVEEAAKRLEMNPQTLRLALQQRLFPFGVAVKTSENRYTYKIFETRLERYLDGSYENILRGATHSNTGGYDWLPNRNEEPPNSNAY